MDERIERQTAYKRAMTLARKVLSAGKNWPASSRGLYGELRQAAVELPAVVAAALLNEEEEATRAGLERALEVACRAEILLEICLGEGGGPVSEPVAALRSLATEAREALADHLSAMKLG